MKSLSRPLVLVLACCVASLAGACAGQEGAPAPHPVMPPRMVGGACAYYPHPGTFTVTSVGSDGSVRFAFHLPAGEPPTWGGSPGSNPNVARFEGDLVGKVAPAPAVGATFPGFRREEISGTCTPWAYSVTIDGAGVPLEPAG